jgi:hypothetical protein
MQNKTDFMLNLSVQENGDVMVSWGLAGLVVQNILIPKGYFQDFIKRYDTEHKPKSHIEVVQHVRGM